MEGVFRVYQKRDFNALDFHNFRMSGGCGKSHKIIESHGEFDVWQCSEWGHYPNGEMSHNRVTTFVAVDSMPSDSAYGMKVEIAGDKILRFIYPQTSQPSRPKIIIYPDFEARLEAHIAGLEFPVDYSDSDGVHVPMSASEYREVRLREYVELGFVGDLSDED